MARLTLLAALAIAGAACGGAAATSGSGGRATSARAAPHTLTSNVRFEDYAGTAACKRCHEAQYASWMQSPMHNMTRDAGAARISGPFDGATFRFKGDTARLETAGGKRYVTVESAKFGSGRYQLTRVIGGHHREDYVGVLVSPDGKRLSDEEVVLPVSFVYATKSLRYKGYSVMVKERSGLRAGPEWGKTCIFCHNTPPHLDTVLGALVGKGARPYQGEVVDALLPKEKRVAWKVTDEDALASTLERELSRIGAPTSGTITPARAIESIRSRFRGEQLVEVGIGCEACHLGSAEHVRDPSVLPSFEPTSPLLSVRYPGSGGSGAREDGASRRAARVNRTCAKCHQVLFSGYEWTWEGGTRKGNPGGGNINSGEARDMLLGACSTKLTCVECHDPHARDATAALRAMSQTEQNGLCTRCHAELASPEAVRAHSHHDPTRAGGACIACHMPRKNMSLDGGLTPYHRIGSPTAPARVLLDRPLECALCHADKTVESLVSTMETWWRRSYDRAALAKLYGALDANVMLATAERGKPHEQAVAFAILGETRNRAAVPVLAAQLTHPYPIVRGYAKRALDAIEGAPVPVDIDADDVALDAQIKAWLSAQRSR
jgi:predicted CXXCH cytochrome family protein